MNSINNSLSEQLKIMLKSGKIKLRYPEGYKDWKKKFDYWYGITKDVHQTLNIIYGPGGGVNDYKGSLYTNSNFKFEKEESNKQKPNEKQMFNLFEVKKK